MWAGSVIHATKGWKFWYNETDYYVHNVTHFLLKSTKAQTLKGYDKLMGIESIQFDFSRIHECQLTFSIMTAYTIEGFMGSFRRANDCGRNDDVKKQSSLWILLFGLCNLNIRINLILSIIDENSFLRNTTWE